MIALGVRYLTKYAAATNLARQRAEWPPHPGRIFMAMAAAHFESGSDPQERSALEWLESAAPPAMRVSEAYERSTVRTYVPVNDVLIGVTTRTRQERAFPRVRPHEDSMFLVWKAAPDAAVRAALDQVCRKVTRVGHSSSAVQMWVVPAGEEPAPNLLPVAGSTKERMRVPAKGTLDSLVNAFNGEAIEEYDRLSESLAVAKGKEKTRIKNAIATRFGGVRPETRRPQLVTWESYAPPGAAPTDPVTDGPFDENFIVLTKEDGPVLGLESTLALTGVCRNAAMRAAGARPPEWLTGHDESGGPTKLNHAAFFPLPFVGQEFSDGHLLGLGIAIPRNLATGKVLGPLFFDQETGAEKDIELWTKSWRWTLRREARDRVPLSLQRSTWTKPSRVWASVTPVVLHHFPKKNRAGDVERIIREAFLSAGYPEPEDVLTRSVSAWEGAGHAMSVPTFQEGGEGFCQYQTHVVVKFESLIRGPVLIGRGRYRGYGLLRPMQEGAAE